MRYLARIARARRPSCAFGSPVLAALNDNCRDFEELRDCLREAQELAAADLGHAVRAVWSSRAAVRDTGDCGWGAGIP